MEGCLNGAADDWHVLVRRLHCQIGIVYGCGGCRVNRIMHHANVMEKVRVALGKKVTL